MGSRGASSGIAKASASTVKAVRGKGNSMGAQSEKMVAMAAILRDYATPGEDYEYYNEKHKKMADMADFLYNTNLSLPAKLEAMKPEEKKLYNEFGADFWSGVKKEMTRIDASILGAKNTSSYLNQYNEMIEKEKGE